MRITILLTILLLLASSTAASYEGYSNPREGFGLGKNKIIFNDEQPQQLSITINDDAIYHQGYYVLNGGDEWTPFKFAKENTNGWITTGKATHTH